MTQSTSAQQLRVSLFDNRERLADNPKSPILTGNIEVPVSRIQELQDYLLAQDTKSYEDREFVTIPVSLWQFKRDDGASSKLKFTGSCSLYRKDQVEQQAANELDELMGEVVHTQQASSPADDADLPQQAEGEAADAVTPEGVAVNF